MDYKNRIDPKVLLLIQDKLNKALQSFVVFSIDYKKENHNQLLSFFSEVKELAKENNLKELGYACLKNEDHIKKNLADFKPNTEYLMSLAKRLGEFKQLLETYSNPISENAVLPISDDADDFYQGSKDHDVTFQSMGRVLVLDDEVLVLNIIEKVLRNRGYDVRVTSSSEQALDVLREREVDVLILDLVMPNINGLDFYGMLKNEDIVVPTILLTASQNKEDHVLALKEGIDDFLRKPFDPEIMIANVEKLIKKENEQKSDYITDALTTAYTRRYFSERFNQEKSKYKRDKNTFSIVFMDLDYFKQINDTYGHSFGDKVLIAFVESFNTNLRPADQIFRYGGDEFLLLLPETDAVEAFKVVERIRTIFQKTAFTHKTTKKEVFVTFSAGISEFNNGDESVDSVLEEVDRQLYRSKERGRACTSFLLDESDASKEKKRVLICEDSSTVGKLIKSRLKRLGLEAQVVYTGQEALDLISSYKPHLLILDIVLPDIHGDSVLEKIRKMSDQCNLKVILISVKSLGVKEKRLKELKYDDFIQKPISMEQLEQSVKRLL